MGGRLSVLARGATVALSMSMLVPFVESLPVAATTPAPGPAGAYSAMADPEEPPT